MLRTYFRNDGVPIRRNRSPELFPPTCCRLAIALAMGFCGAARAEFTTVINVPPELPPEYIIESNTQLNVGDGGWLNDLFVVGRSEGTMSNVQLNISGGTIRPGLRAYDGSEVNITGGTVGGYINAYAGSVTKISGGTVGNRFAAENGSIVTISGGAVGNDFEANRGSEVDISGGSIGKRMLAIGHVNISGGVIGDELHATSRSAVNISGGGIGSRFLAHEGGIVNISGGTFGSIFGAEEESAVTLSGRNFRLNGELIPGLKFIGDTLAVEFSEAYVLSGTFTDGTSFSFTNLDGDLIENGALTLEVAELVNPGPDNIEVVDHSAPIGVHDGQTLTLQEFGSLGSNFNAGWGSTLRVNGGVVGDGLEAFHATIEISGGTVGDNVKDYGGSTIEITGGTVGDRFQVLGESVVNISGGLVGRYLSSYGGETIITGGIVGDDFEAHEGSTIRITGGTVGSGFIASAGSEVLVSGGRFHDDFRADPGSAVNVSGGTFGSEFAANSDSIVRFIGDDFRLNGVPFEGLSTIGNSLAVNVPIGSVLSGTLADGTPFAFSSLGLDRLADDTITLEVAALPAIGRSAISLPVDSAPLGIREGQTLAVEVEGRLAENFLAGRGSSVYVNGGYVAPGFTAIGAHVNIDDGTVSSDFHAYDGSTVDISSGVVLNRFTAAHSSIVNLSGGRVADDFRLLGGSTLNLTGGSLLENCLIDSGSAVNISGGEIQSGIEVVGGSTMNVSSGSVGHARVEDSGSSVNIDGGYTLGVEARHRAVVNVTDGDVRGLGATNGGLIFVSGGVIERGVEAFDEGTVVEISGGLIGALTAGSGSEFQITGAAFGDSFESRAGSVVRMSGADFRLDNQPIEGLAADGDTLNVNVPNGAILSGVLADGSPIVLTDLDLDEIADGTITLRSAELPPVGTNSIVVPSAPAPRGIRSMQQLTVGNGGLLDDHFTAIQQSKLYVNGGSVGRNLEAYQAEVFINDGRVGEYLDAFEGSTINIAGGTVGAKFDAHPGSTVHVSGGRIRGEFEASADSIVNISGGTIGHKFRAEQGSTVTIQGADFRRDGQEIEGLSEIGSTLALNLAEGSVLSGVYADGTPFSFSSHRYDEFSDGTLTLEFVEVPLAKPTEFYVPNEPAPLGVRAGESLVVEEGGSIDEFFHAGRGGNVQLVGGQIGKNFDAFGANVTLSAGSIDFGFHAFDRSNVIVTGGTLGGGARTQDSSITISGGHVGLDLADTSTVDISGGSIGPRLDVRFGSTINVSGGAIDEELAISDSVVNISGGSVAGGFRATEGSIVNISGGTIGSYFGALGGSTVNVIGGSVGYGFGTDGSAKVNISGGHFGNRFHAHGENMVDISGGDFRLNGVPLDRLRNVGDQEVFNLPDGTFLTGTFADGTPFVFSMLRDDVFDDDAVTLHTVELPALGTGVVNVPGVDTPLGVRNGQTLVLDEGGALGDNFIAGWNSTLRIRGGQLGENVEAVGARVDMSAGSIGRYFKTYLGSRVSISGGFVDYRMDLSGHSNINISGTAVVDGLLVHDGSTATISGGSVEGSLYSYYEGNVSVFAGNVNHLNVGRDTAASISGGLISNRLEIESGGTARIAGGSIERVVADDDSLIHLYVLDFNLNGVELPDIQIGETTTIELRNLSLNGILADGSPIKLDMSIIHPILGGNFEDNVVVKVTLFDILPGDYNDDGIVNAADYIVWKNHEGQTLALPNEDPITTPGEVTDGDYYVWRHNYGRTTGSVRDSSLPTPPPGFDLAVPEPMSALLLVAGLIGVANYRRRWLAT
jgi:hypothetical protein